MIKFISLTIRNFLSYGNAITVFDLHNPGTTLIVGENLDDTTYGEGANGTGKTAVINALTYALYDKPISNISKENLINNQNKTNMEVTVTFCKDDRYYHVRRCRKMTKTKPSGSFVQLFERNDNIEFAPEDETTLDSITNTNMRIESLLGIPYELFVRIIVFSAMHEPFLDLPARTQIDVIEGLVGLRILTEKADVLKIQTKETDQQIELEEQNIRFQEENKKQHLERVRTAKQRVISWASENQQQIKRIQTEITAMSNVDFTKENETHTQLEALQTDIDDVVKQERFTQERVNAAEEQKRKLQKIIAQDEKSLELIADIDLLKERELHDEKNKTQQEQNRLQQEIKTVTSITNTLMTKWQELDNEIQHLQDDKCPYCKQRLPSAKQKLKEIVKLYSDKDAELQAKTNELKTLNEQYTKIKKHFVDITKQITVNNINELMKINSESAVMTQRVTDNTKAIIEIEESVREQKSLVVKQRQQSSTLLEEYSTLKKQVKTSNKAALLEIKSKNEQLGQKLDELNNAINPHMDALDELEQQQIEDANYKKIEELQHLNVHQKFLIKLLTKKDSFVRKALLDKHLQYLNQRLQTYLHELGLPHNVVFTSEFTAKITEFDHELDFGNLSNGQKSRVNLALSLAFRDYLQSVHSTVNVCLFDEVLDVGLDSVGVQLAAHALQHKAHEEKSSLYVISHRDEITHSFDHKMVVSLQKGFSYIQSEY